MFWILLAVILSLGIDNLIVSAAIGLSNGGNKFRTALTFAVFEAVMPMFGFFLGTSLGLLFEKWAFYAGVAFLSGLGLYYLFKNEDREEKLVASLAGELRGWTLILTGIFISLDEMFVGSSFGLIGLPIVLTSVILGVQAFVFTLLGISFARQIQPLLGGAAEKIAGMTLIALAVGLTVEKLG